VDSDLSFSTGFRGFLNDSPIGIDYLLEGGSIFEYTGTGNDWSWNYLGSTTIAVNADSVELRVPANLLGDADVIDVFFRGDSSARGGTGIDFYPDAANTPAAAEPARRFRYTRDPTRRMTDRSALLDSTGGGR